VGERCADDYTSRMTPKQFPPLPSHRDAEILSDETVWHGRFQLQLVRFRNRRFDGLMSGVRTWELWRRGRGAALLPYDVAADAVLLIEQFRLPALAAGLDPVLVELPAGLVDDGEQPEATIRREAEEERGVAPRRLIKIGEVLLSPGGSDELVSLYVGEVTAPPAGPDGIVGSGGLAAEDEDIRVRRWSATEAIEAALAGRFVNCVTGICLLWLAARREQVRASWRNEP
jgi:ADP-ribose pyrophosphatase